MKNTLIMMLAAASVAQAEVNFKPIAPTDAQRAARDAHQGVMIDFYTDWCYWCKVLDGKTFSDNAVGNFANAKFIPIKLDAEKGDGPQWARKYGVTGYPTILFLDGDGHEQYRVVGYEPPEKFLNSMNVASMGTTAQLEANMQAHPDDANAVYALAQKYSSAGDKDRALDLYRRVVSLDKDNRQMLAEQAALAVAQFESKNGNNAALESYVADYPNAHGMVEVSNELALRYVRAKDAAKAQKYFALVAESGPPNPDRMIGFAWECAQQRVNLTHALEYARRAVALSTGPVQQATFLDTQAEVLNAMGNKAGAAQAERDALALLVNEASNARLRSELEKRLQEFSH